MTSAALLLGPKGKGKPPTRHTFASGGRALGEAQRSSTPTSEVASLFLRRPAMPRRSSPPDLGCCRRALTHALCNFPALRGDQRQPVQKQSTGKSNDSEGDVAFTLPPGACPRSSARGSVPSPLPCPGNQRLLEQGAGRSGNLSRVHVCAPRPDLLPGGRARGDCVLVARQRPWVLPASVPYVEWQP